MATKNFTLRIDDDLRKESEELFERLGLNMSTAITVFLRQSVIQQELPFEITTTKKQRDPMVDRLMEYVSLLKRASVDTTSDNLD